MENSSISCRVFTNDGKLGSMWGRATRRRPYPFLPSSSSRGFYWFCLYRCRTCPSLLLVTHTRGMSVRFFIFLFLLLLVLCSSGCSTLVFFSQKRKTKKCENQMSLLSEQSMGCEKWWELLRKDYPSSNLTDFFILSRYYLKNNRIWQKHLTTTIKGMVYSFTHTKSSLTPFGSLFAPVSLFLLGRSCFVARLGFTWLGSFSWSSLAGREVLSQCSQFFRRAHFCKKMGVFGQKYGR